jgi:hypothetical protein
VARLASAADLPVRREGPATAGGGADPETYHIDSTMKKKAWQPLAPQLSLPGRQTPFEMQFHAGSVFSRPGHNLFRLFAAFVWS